MLKKSEEKNEPFHKNLFELDGYKLKIKLFLSGVSNSRDNVSVFVFGFWSI